MQWVYLALGSNLGDREEYLRSGIRALSASGIDRVRCASVYSTEPKEMQDQPWFLNTALEGATLLAPDELLRACLMIEQANLRKRVAPKGPRTLDIDIIFYGNRVIHQPGLTIPHPRFAGRRFVLAPLAEIAPDFVDPVSNKTVRELFQECPDPAAVVVYGPPLK